MNSFSVKDKFERLKTKTLFPLLTVSDRELVEDLALRYRLTFQELKLLCEALRDLEMWQIREGGDRLKTLETDLPLAWDIPEKKHRLLESFFKWVAVRRGEAKEYPVDGFGFVSRSSVEIVESPQGNIWGTCPAYSKKTLCCGLKTMDAVQNCAYGCSYCTLQTFFGGRIRFDPHFAEKLKALQLDPQRFYHIGTGQSSDSLAWGNRWRILDALLSFARKYPNVLFEFKTKSANVEYLLSARMPRNLVCSWSLNTERIVRCEEHLTAALHERLEAARLVADRGIAIAFHFHPLIYYKGWDEEYASLASRVQEIFAPEEVRFVSFGTVTLIKPVIDAIRRRGGASKVLQMEMVPDPHGKLTYPDYVKEKLYSHIYQAFTKWHGQVYFYLCMERADMWEKVFGWSYPDNSSFHADFAEHCGFSNGRRE